MRVRLRWVMAIGCVMLAVASSPVVAGASFQGTRSIALSESSRAVEKAKSYLKYMAFSESGLVEQLEYSGFSHADALQAVSNLQVDWNEQAQKKAKSYLEFSAFSAKGLVEQLEYEGFSEGQAQQAVASLQEDWNAQAAAKAKSYLAFSSFSYNSLVDQLVFDGFTNDQARYGVEHSDSGLTESQTSTSSGNQEQAVKKAQSYLQFTSFSKKGLAEQLEFEGFSSADAAYGAEHSGADWNEQAAKSAASYVRLMSMSNAELRDQLAFGGFTESEIAYAIAHFSQYL